MKGAEVEVDQEVVHHRGESQKVEVLREEKMKKTEVKVKKDRKSWENIQVHLTLN